MVEGDGAGPLRAELSAYLVSLLDDVDRVGDPLALDRALFGL